MKYLRDAIGFTCFIGGAFIVVGSILVGVLCAILFHWWIIFAVPFGMILGSMLVSWSWNSPVFDL